MALEPDELAEAQIARLRELHAGGAISDEELREGLVEVREATGTELDEGGAEPDSAPRRSGARAIIIAFLAIDVLVLSVVALIVFAR